MATFNSMPAMSAAGAADTMTMNNGNGQPMTMEHFEQDLNFDEALL